MSTQTSPPRQHQWTPEDSGDLQQTAARRTRKRRGIAALALGAVLAAVGLVVVLSTGDDDGGAPGGRAAPAADKPLAFGDSYTYEDGLKVRVSVPQPYRPGESAAGHQAGNQAVKVTVEVVNGGSESASLDLSSVEVKDADGLAVESVYDEEFPKELSGRLLPGRTATGQYVFDLPADAAGSLAVYVGPSVMDYDEAVWSGSAK